MRITYLRQFENLPDSMRTEAVKPYYDALNQKRISLLIKRVFDFSMALVLLVLFSPLLLILSTLIFLDSKGGVFYRQERVTTNGKIFRIHKFRTMVKNADKIGSQVTIDHDTRVTRVGKLIRKYRLDEIPQLIDILEGNMSFVGTRPEVPKYVACYTPEMMATLLLPAGVTSEASYRFKDEARLLSCEGDVDEIYTKEILPRKMEYNLKMIKSFSLVQDFKIIIETILELIR